MMINQAGNLNKEDKRIFNNNGRFLYAILKNI